MILKKIFKKTSTGKTVEWEIEILDNKYRTITGQKGGKKIISKWTECKEKNIGKKNATTAKQQALKEAQALRTKKLEKDYKEDIEEISDIGYFKPMLAYEYKTDILFGPTVFSQPKLDGIRGIIKENEIKSRNGKLFTSVPHLTSEFYTKVHKKYPTVLFDGELYNHLFKEDFNEIASIIKRTNLTPEDISKSAEFIQHWTYDLYDTARPTLKFEDRYKLLCDIFKECALSDSFVLVPTTKIYNNAELDKKFEKYVEYGYEGQMIRLNKEYQNKRSKFLLKRKEFITEEFIVMDILEGVGNRSGTAGYITTVTKDGKEFSSNIKGPYSYLTKIFNERDKYIGTEATIRFFNYTPDGIPRFPYVIAFDRKSYE